jgi:hypothetical protein
VDAVLACFCDLYFHSFIFMVQVWPIAGNGFDLAVNDVSPSELLV